MRRRAGRRAGTVALLTAAACATGATAASARSFTVDYDWTQARYGFEGWKNNNMPAGGDWYSTQAIRGTGLKISATGHGQDPYKDVLGNWTWDVPGAASLTKVRLGGLEGRAIDRQFGRAWLVLDNDVPPRPTSFELRYGAGTPNPTAPGTTWDRPAPQTVITPAGRRGIGFVLWLFTIPCDDVPPTPNCVNADPADDPNVSLSSIHMTLNDPTTPTLDAGNLPDGSTWTKARRLDLAASAVDPESGVAQIQAKVAAGGTTRTVPLGRWTPDRLNTVPRDPATPQLTATRTVARSVALPARGTARLTIEATNAAGMRQTVRGRVRVDRDRPAVRWPKKLRAGSTVTVSDRTSGVKTASLSLPGAPSIDTCANAARSCRLRVPSPVGSRTAVSVQVGDQAGNSRSGSRRSIKVRVPKKKRTIPSFCGDEAAYSQTIRGRREAIGGDGPDVIFGTRGDDDINGRAGADCILGDSGDDTVTGSFGDDRIQGGKGIDSISGGDGDDVIDVADGTRDVVVCNDGRDTVFADRRDLVDRDCERVVYGKASR